jgi:hypothetical protein
LNGTPVAGLILIHPRVQIKAVEGDTLFTDLNFNKIRTDLGVETVPIHPKIERCVPQPDQSWRDG